LLIKRSSRRPRYIGVELRGVHLVLDGHWVLRDIRWHIQPGQRWVLIGPNGAGKTQLLKLLAGDVWPSGSCAGLRRYRCQDEFFDEPYGIKEAIAYLGPERQDRYEHYEWNYRVDAVIGTGLHRTDIPLQPLTGADQAQIARLLRRLDIEPLARRRFLTLSYGERRLVLLARALASRPRLLLLDELFNGLDALHRQCVQRCLQHLSRSALPWVLSTHRAEDIPRAATHLCRLERGRIHSRRRFGSIARRASPRAGLPARKAPRQSSRAGAPAPAFGVPLITLRHATLWREGVMALCRLSLQIRAGECWVVHGPNGSGKSSFIEMLYGNIGIASGGAIARAGMDSGVPIEVFKRRVGLVAPQLQTIHPRYLRVEEVVASGVYASVGLNAQLGHADRQRARRALRELGILALAAQPIRALSYGQLRRVLFARALIHQPDMLLLDEPYAGVDARTRLRLRARVQRALESGVTVVLATHHRDEWPTAATHELELHRARAVYAGPLRA
jgi:molybdate transport system ATP-binding protein